MDLTEIELREHLVLVCHRAQGIGKWCEPHGLSPAFVGMVIHGAKKPSAKVLDALGLRRVVTYTSKENNDGR